MPPPNFFSYKALISYDGTLYFGWQKTNAGPSIQEELEKAIKRITKEKPHLNAVSRTDRGVHAKGQLVQFFLGQEFPLEKLLFSLNAVLPSDIRIKELHCCDFHPSRDVVYKEYEYRISIGSFQEPIERLYSWHVVRPLDLEKIERAIPHLLGERNFQAFANEPEENPICSLHAIEVHSILPFSPSSYFPRSLVTFCIRGDRFLYKMVRNLVGTLVYVGQGALKIEALPSILASKKRENGAVSAPAHGLYLKKVVLNKDLFSL